MTKIVKRIDICRVEELAKTQCKTFTLNVDGGNIEGFLIKTEHTIVAYKNACPHWNVELNWKPDDFLNEEHSHILCSIHGALFRKDDGLCVAGPCVRQNLESIPVGIQEGVVFFLSPSI
ncbi:MAG: Rieske (2Fe-2S) protein [Gammaproteobacteria bacterium]